VKHKHTYPRILDHHLGFRETRDLRVFSAHKALADHSYDRAFSAWLHKLPPLPDETFWRVGAAYSRQVFESAVLGRKRNGRFGVKMAADELFRLARAREADYSLFDCVRFAARWDHFDEVASGGLEGVELNRGDDSFGDLCDSVPLCGASVMAALKAGKVKTEKDLDDLVMTETSALVLLWGGDGKNAERFFKLVVNGENYNSMTLTEQAKEDVVIEAAGLMDDLWAQEEDDDEED
jgi:hypothetical protein